MQRDVCIRNASQVSECKQFELIVRMQIDGQRSINKDISFGERITKASSRMCAVKMWLKIGSVERVQMQMASEVMRGGGVGRFNLNCIHSHQ